MSENERQIHMSDNEANDHSDYESESAEEEEEEEEVAPPPKQQRQKRVQGQRTMQRIPQLGSNNNQQIQQQQPQQQQMQQPQQQYQQVGPQGNIYPMPVAEDMRRTGYMNGPYGAIRQSRIKDRPESAELKDDSLKIKIELDLEVEVDLYARVKGDVSIGLM